MLVQPAVCGIYDLPPLSSFFLFLFSSIEKRKSFLPRNGVFFSPLGRGGNVCAPHFFFSRERKRNVPRPVQRKRALGAALRAESCSFFFCALRPDSGFPGAMRTGFTTCAAAADGCGWAGLRAGTSGFRCESCSFSFVLYVLIAVPWCCADWFRLLRRCR